MASTSAGVMDVSTSPPEATSCSAVLLPAKTTVTVPYLKTHDSNKMYTCVKPSTHPSNQSLLCIVVYCIISIKD